MLLLLDIHQNALFAYAVFKCNADCFKDANIVLKTNRISIEFFRNSSPCQFNVITPENFVQLRSVALCTNNTIGCITIYQENVTKLNLSVIRPNVEPNADEDLINPIVEPNADENPINSNIESNPDESPINSNVEPNADEGPINPNVEPNADEGPVPLEFIFLFHIQSNDVIEECICRKSDSPTCLKDVMYDKYKTINACKVICTNCGMLLTENFMKFESIQKYYDWKSELDETSFCHKHDDHNATEIKANSLYIDDMYFYFHHSMLAHLKLIEENKTYKCFKCSSTLSFQKKMDNLQYIGFFCDKIMLTMSQDGDNYYEKHKEDACLLSFYSIIQEVLKTDLSPKLYLQSKVGETTDVLLLWIDGEKVVQFILEESDENKMQENVELKGKEVYSVLYCSTSPDSDLSRGWKHDFGVEFFQISDNMMNIIKRLFQESSDYFSEWKESNPGFTFGYLPVEVPIF